MPRSVGNKLAFVVTQVGAGIDHTIIGGEVDRTLSANAPTEDEDYLSGCGLTEPTPNSGLLITPLQDDHLAMDNDPSPCTASRDSLCKCYRKVASLLIHQPPKQPPPTKSVLSFWSKRLVAQGHSRVPASKRGERSS
jgi:hypothetical protein